MNEHRHLLDVIREVNGIERQPASIPNALVQLDSISVPPISIVEFQLVCLVGVSFLVVVSTTPDPDSNRVSHLFLLRCSRGGELVEVVADFYGTVVVLHEVLEAVGAQLFDEFDSTVEGVDLETRSERNGYVRPS